MRKLILTILLWYCVGYAQISQRCSVCPPSIKNVPDGYVLTVDSSGKRVVWAAGGGGGGGFWSTAGNSGLSASTNFIGTTDDVNLIFKHNNVYSGGIGGNNVCFGENVLSVDTGTSNVAIGGSALHAMHNAGSSNVAIGYNSLVVSTDGSANTAVGNGALSSDLTGFGNTGIGANTFNLEENGNYNSAVGYQAGIGFAHGDGNIYLGYQSGPDGGNTQSYGIAIGHSAKARTHGMAFGYGAVAPDYTIVWSDSVQADYVPPLVLKNLDSVTIYTVITPATGMKVFCNNCTGNGITGRELCYISGAWRRTKFD